MSSEQRCIQCNKLLPQTARSGNCPNCKYPFRIISPVAASPRRRLWLALPAAVLVVVVLVLLLNKDKTPATPAPSTAPVPEPAVVAAGPEKPAVVAADPEKPAVVAADPEKPAVVAALPDVPESTELGWKFVYDDDGRITRTVNPAGQVTNIRYEQDAKKNVTKVIRELPGGEVVTQGFDREGKRIAMTDGLGAIAYEYDGLGRLTEVKREGSLAIHYGYDTQNRVSRIRVGDDYSLTYVYDFLGRLEAIETPAGRIGYEYSAKERTVQRTLPNSVQTKWQYAASGQIEKIEHASRDKSILASFAYSYRPDGLIQEVTETGPESESRIAYEYDNVQRLISVSDSRKGRTLYRYDALGNRLEVTEPDRPESVTTFDWLGRLVRHRGERCTHDAAGNVTQYVGNNGPVKLTHTADGQLRSATTDKATINCRYDGEGNLVRREVNGQTTTFIPDPVSGSWKPFIATDAMGKQTAYLWDGDTPLAEKVNGEWRFFLNNHQETVRCVVDGQGKVLERPSYCAFGRPTGDVNKNFGPAFAGLFYDPQTALYLTKARAYEPALGRFLQIDPQHRISFGSQKDLVSYSYCGADPVNFVDLDGCAPWPPPPPPVFRNDIPIRVPLNVQQFMAPRHAQPASREMAAFQSLLPRNSSEWKLPFNFGNWAGAFREPARGLTIPADERGWQQWAKAQNLPRWIDAVDKGAFYHDLRLGRLSAFDPKLNFLSLNDLAVGIVHQQLASDWKAAAGRPDTTIAGRMSANSAAWFFQSLANISYVLSSVPSFGRHTILPSVGIVPSALPGRSTVPSTGGAERKGGTSPASPFLAAHLRSVPSLSNAEMRAIGSAKSFSALWEVMNGSSGGSPPPTPVGGVSLSGAGNTLAPLGRLRGVSVDGQGRLVLLGEKHPTIELPPVRLDDVVTIFRGVYDNKSPYVSIDPDPKAPNGPTMNIRHSPGTADTYVGWVLFEADRVMKTYSLGKDNLTGAPFQSKIARHDEYLRLLFSGQKEEKAEELWERFWIVPSQVTHRAAKDGKTALTEVPLKLRTEAMVMRDGKLVTAPKGQSSKSAEFFTKWFTDNYEAIAKENRSRTPKGSGMDADVPVFAELQRLAVIVAVAERLRDQGVPMPGWMRDYPVKPFPFPATTPATTAERTVGNATYSVYGGVTLSVPPDQVRSVESPEAEALAPLVRTAVTDALDLSRVSVGPGGLDATALPASGAVALGANRLTEVDLRIPLPGGYELPLVRQFDSFHAPVDVFGQAWTFDLPRLEQRVGALTDKLGTRRVYFELVSPLGSASGIFADIKHVPEANGQLLVPTEPGGFLGLADSNDLGIPTQLLMFRDGRKWHFDTAGDLVAAEEAPLSLRFHRDANRRLERIEAACSGGKASILLEYDSNGRLRKAVGSDKQVATYTYNATGHLERVERSEAKTGYEYKGTLVSAVLENGAPPRRFEYAAGGRLRQEQSGKGVPISYEVAMDPAGRTIRSTEKRPDSPASTSEYDARFRPVRQSFSDGTTAAWQYLKDGTTETTITPAEGRPSVVRRSADGRSEDYILPGLDPVTAECDSAGRLKEIRQGKVQVASRTWLANGLPATESDATTTRRFVYRPDGSLSGVRLAPVKGNGQGEMVDIGFDTAGRPETMTDESGAVTKLKYDAMGRPVGVTTAGAEVAITYDADGPRRSVTTLPGRVETIDYDKASGLPQRVEVSAEGKTAFAEYNRGRPSRMRQFDGGESIFTYPDRPDAPPGEIRTPNNLVLKFEYDGKSRAKKVRCGDSYQVEYEFNARGQPTGLRLTATR